MNVPFPKHIHASSSLKGRRETVIFAVDVSIHKMLRNFPLFLYKCF